MTQSNPPVPSRQAVRFAPTLCVSFIFFLIVCLCVNTTLKGTAVFVALLTLAGVAVAFKRLRSRIHLPMAALFGVVLITGLSALYAGAGKMAVFEYPKVLVAFCIALLALCFTGGEGVTLGRKLASYLEAAAGIAGVVSIDLISTHFLSGLVLSFLECFTKEYTTFDFYETGSRINSLFDNPNVFASCMGIGVLLSLGLVTSSEDQKERNGHIIFLAINSLAFVLAFSMGATASILPAFLICLVLERGERRGGLFLLMLETLVITIGAAAIISATSFQNMDAFQPIPLLATAGSALLLVEADYFVGRKLEAVLRSRRAAAAAGTVLILGALIFYCAAALTTTGSITMGSGEKLRRSIYPAPGEYTLLVSATGEAKVKVTSQNQQDTMMHTSTVLYNGDLNAAEFTVPEDSLVVFLDITAKSDLSIDSIEYNGLETGSVALDYKLLPSFVANRLQGLKANENAIQRTVFFADGMKLFQRSPVIGLGIGAFENGMRSVQSFKYDTKYVHNHYIQTLVETGVIGLLLFLFLLGSSAAAILRARRREDAHPLIPALGGALVFMAVHAFTEIIFSYYVYLPFAFCVFALINLCCGEALPLPFKGKAGRRVRSGICATAIGLVAVFMILLIGNLSAAATMRKAMTLDNLEKAIKMDVFEWETYAIAYAVTSSETLTAGMGTNRTALEYCMRLRETDSVDTPIYVARYYFNVDIVDRGFDMAEKYVLGKASDEDAWNETFTLLAQYVSLDEYYIEGVQRIYNQMVEWNENNIGKLTLSDESREFLNMLGVIE